MITSTSWGGWSVSQQFDDVHMLENDGSTLTSRKVVTKSGPGIPDLYPCPPCRTGRSLNQTRPRGMHQNNIQVLDCPSSADSNAWRHPEIAGTIPIPRSDTAIIHSKDSGRIFFFGGSIFDVYDIVGPPRSRHCRWITHCRCQVCVSQRSYLLHATMK